jgi:hypothetical protein
MKWKYVLGLMVIGGLLALAGWAVKAAPAPETSPEELFKKAQVNGKYRMLLARIKVEDDAEKIKDVKDEGFKNRTEYAGHKNLPAGHWVYAAPYWYVWRDEVAKVPAKRQWGPEQACGEPDTNMAGDIVTAWASLSQDDMDEWLILEYDEFVNPTAILVYETFNPGALVKVSAFKPDGEEVEVWKGQDPTATDAGMGTSEIPVKIDFKTNRVKIYIDSKNVPGWNEIDAVGIRDKGKKMHWAVAADASSTYAQLQAPAAPPPPAVEPPARGEERLRKLEKEVEELKKTVEELKKALDKKNK